MAERQGLGALAAVLLFALVLVAILTASAVLLLGLHRRRMRRSSGRPASPTASMDAWRESGRRAAPPEQDEA